jgi:hypothetical protein
VVYCTAAKATVRSQGAGLAVYAAETALRNYLTTGGSLFSAPGESPDSYATVTTFLMIVSCPATPWSPPVSSLKYMSE